MRFTYEDLVKSYQAWVESCPTPESGFGEFNLRNKLWEAYVQVRNAYDISNPRPKYAAKLKLIKDLPSG